MDVRRLTTFLLELHSKSRALPYRAMQHAALERFRELVPFEAGLFGVGTIQQGDAQGHDVYVFHKPPELMVRWQAVRNEDPITFVAAASPGTTINTSLTSALYEDVPRVRELCAAFDIAHVMCTAQIYAEAGLYWIMSIYRSERQPAFSEDERITNELVAPHLFCATRQARISELRTLIRGGPSHGYVAAIASAAGLVLEIDGALVDILRAEWPMWRGPLLPPPLHRYLAAGSGRFVGRRIVVHIDATDGARLVHARLRLPADELTERERQIADAFALGESHREIGGRLHISPATVRRHLANLYAKLGVSSKAELDRMLRGTD